MSLYSTVLERTSSQYWSITDASQTGLDITGDMTIEMWIKIEDQLLTGERMNMMAKWDTASNQRSHIFQYKDDSGTIGIRMQTSSNGSGVNTGSTITQTLTAGVWVHVACVYDASASSCEIYINGSSVGTSTGLNTSLFDSSAPFTIGASGIPNNYLDAKIADARVWNDVRTSGEISANYNKAISASSANLQANWFTGAQNGNDATSNNNDLTNNNSATFELDYPYSEATEVDNAVFFGCNF